MINSTLLAADKTLFEVWDRKEKFPSFENIEDVDIITFATITKGSKEGYHFLLKATIQWHKDRFYAAFHNSKLTENENNSENLIRGCTSVDGIHWTEPQIWIQKPTANAISFNHPLLFSDGETLYGFFVCWNENYKPRTEIFTLDEENKKWIRHPEAVIPEFLPFCTPQLLENGNYIMGGEKFWYQSAVLISRGKDLLHWDLVKVSNDQNLQIIFPESSVINLGQGHLLNFCRPYNDSNKPLKVIMLTAPVSESFDYGESWSNLKLSNLPLTNSQPFAGRLSNGQKYLIFNSLEEDRALLNIALTSSEGKLFKKIYKIRHQSWPARRVFGGFGKETYVGKPTEWSYPNATEHDGKLYIVYDQGKEDCVVSIIPIEELKVD